MAQITTSRLAKVPFETGTEEFSVSGGDWIASRGEELRKLCIPAPRPRIAARIDDLAELIGGDSDPFYCGRYNSLVGARLPQARTIILGTACRRPLLCEEARDLQAISGGNVLVLRLEEKCAGDAAFTFDLFDAVSRHCFPDLSLWVQHGGSALWLAPGVPSAPWVRLFIDGIRMSPPPSDNAAVLDQGFEAARALLPVSGSGARLG